VGAALDVPPYSTDIAAAWEAVANFFRGGEAIQLGQDLDGQWIVHLSKWTNGGEYGPRIWDVTAWRQSYKGLTAPHAISLIIASFFDHDEDSPFASWEYDPMIDDINHYDDRADAWTPDPA
jgi:hypothetical protein